MVLPVCFLNIVDYIFLLFFICILHYVMLCYAMQREHLQCSYLLQVAAFIHFSFIRPSMSNQTFSPQTNQGTKKKNSAAQHCITV